MPDPVWEKLSHIQASLQPGDTLIITHGAARGVDTAASDWVGIGPHRGRIVVNDPHPADWEGDCQSICNHGPRRLRRDGVSICQAAGMYRNQRMVDLKPNYAVAFPLKGPRSLSKGTWGCIDMICRAKIRHEVIPI